jgi:hypothetical protein
MPKENNEHHDQEAEGAAISDTAKDIKKEMNTSLKGLTLLSLSVSPLIVG